MKKAALEIIILLILVGYVAVIEFYNMHTPGSRTILYIGIGIAALYTGLVLFSPRRIKLARLWAAFSIAAMIYWIYLLINIK
jgi:hypothetical protein